MLGMLFLQGLQILGLLVGGTLAGAGQRRGVMLGIIVGSINGIVSLVVQFYLGSGLSQLTFYGLPLIHMMFGAVGGWRGFTIWKPIPPNRDPRELTKEVKPKLVNTYTAPATFSGPIGWGRVLLGAALASLGTIFAKSILDLLTDSSEGKLSLDSYRQAE